MKSRFDIVKTNYKNCTKSRLGFVRKIMGIIHISDAIHIEYYLYFRTDFVEKKKGVGQKVDQDEKKEKKKETNFWPLSESLTRFTKKGCWTKRRLG